jgi:hypothetical protein
MLLQPRREIGLVQLETLLLGLKQKVGEHNQRAIWLSA